MHCNDWFLLKVCCCTHSPWKSYNKSWHHHQVFMWYDLHPPEACEDGVEGGVLQIDAQEGQPQGAQPHQGALLSPCHGRSYTYSSGHIMCLGTDLLWTTHLQGIWKEFSEKVMLESQGCSGLRSTTFTSGKWKQIQEKYHISSVLTNLVSTKFYKSTMAQVANIGSPLKCKIWFYNCLHVKLSSCITPIFRGVFKFLKEGLSNKELAEFMFISLDCDGIIIAISDYCDLQGVDLVNRWGDDKDHEYVSMSVCQYDHGAPHGEHLCHGSGNYWAFTKCINIYIELVFAQMQNT